MSPIRSLTIAVATLLVLGACRPSYPQQIAPLSGPALYDAALREFERRRWDNAIMAFERLSRELPARDTLLPRVYLHLGQAHSARNEHLLAAQAFQRIMDSFPNDTLADDGLLLAGRAYAAMWRRSSLDAEYAQTAVSTLQTLLALYPNADVREEAQHELNALYDRLANKDYQTGMWYFRNRAFFSAIIYFEDVVERFPDTPTARLARIRIVEAYRRERWAAQAEDACEALVAAYPGDREVGELCGAPPPAAAGTS
ncbi:MAG TPA: outer membrane protein assembly factor BamD [Gemmatimonadaceae bacterium]|nr:outer membrane protein assembly factor BamD [Gemmatimonadaceae bacterium]